MTDKERKARIKESEEKIKQIKVKILLCNGFNRKNRDEIFALIDSLRPQSHWEPSKEELEALNVAKDRNDKIGFVLGELYEQLKALKGE